MREELLDICRKIQFAYTYWDTRCSMRSTNSSWASSSLIKDVRIIITINTHTHTHTTCVYTHIHTTHVRACAHIGPYSRSWWTLGSINTRDSWVSISSIEPFVPTSTTNSRSARTTRTTRKAWSTLKTKKTRVNFHT